MTIVKELNNLSEKVTGKNAKAYTDAQAVKFIADNYEGGGAKTPIVLDLTTQYNDYITERVPDSKTSWGYEITPDSDLDKAIEAVYALTEPTDVYLKLDEHTFIKGMTSGKTIFAWFGMGGLINDHGGPYKAGLIAIEVPSQLTNKWVDFTYTSYTFSFTIPSENQS